MLRILIRGSDTVYIVRRRSLLRSIAVSSPSALAGCFSGNDSSPEAGTDPDDTGHPNGEQSVERLSNLEVNRTNSLTYTDSPDGSLELDLYLPDVPLSRPTVLVIHGGGWEQGSRTQLAWHADRLAREGFVAATISYRFSQVRPYPAAIQDVNAAIAWLRANASTYDIDPTRIATLGWSAGAHLAALAAVAPDVETFLPDETNSDESSAQAMVGVAGYYDFRRLESDEPGTVKRFLGGTYEEVPDRYEQASPVSHVDPDDPPALLFHGEDDDVVPLEQSRTFSARLGAAGIDATLETLESAGHGLIRESPTNAQVMDQTVEFLYEQWGSD